MTPSVQRLGDERGIALILALMVLLTLSGLSLALLATADASWVVLPSLDGAALPGLTPAEGTYVVSIRNDRQAADGMTVRSAGTFNTTTRTIEVVVRRVAEGSSEPTRRVFYTISGWREF